VVLDSHADQFKSKQAQVLEAVLALKTSDSGLLDVHFGHVGLLDDGEDRVRGIGAGEIHGVLRDDVGALLIDGQAIVWVRGKARVVG